MTKTKTTKRRKTLRRAQPATASVIAADWRALYAKNGGSCGDQLATRLRRHLEADDGSIDLAKLKRLAQANDCWQPGYSNLNAGMTRLCVGNRLRARVRNGTKVVWK